MKTGFWFHGAGLRGRDESCEALNRLFPTVFHGLFAYPPCQKDGLFAYHTSSRSGYAIQQARDLLASLDLSHVVGLRDRALLGTLAYTGARVGALARLRRGDLKDQGAQRVLRFREKGGQQRGCPTSSAPTASASWW